MALLAPRGLALAARRLCPVVVRVLHYSHSRGLYHGSNLEHRMPMNRTVSSREATSRLSQLGFTSRAVRGVSPPARRGCQMLSTRGSCCFSGSGGPNNVFGLHVALVLVRIPTLSTTRNTRGSCSFAKAKALQGGLCFLSPEANCTAGEPRRRRRRGECCGRDRCNLLEIGDGESFCVTFTGIFPSGKFGMALTSSSLSPAAAGVKLRPESGRQKVG